MSAPLRGERPPLPMAPGTRAARARAVRNRAAAWSRSPAHGPIPGTAVAVLVVVAASVPVPGLRAVGLVGFRSGGRRERGRRGGRPAPRPQTSPDRAGRRPLPARGQVPRRGAELAQLSQLGEKSEQYQRRHSGSFHYIALVGRRAMFSGAVIRGGFCGGRSSLSWRARSLWSAVSSV